MLPNIDRALYGRFKREGYRIKQYAESPVTSIDEIVHLGYLDVNRTIEGIEPEQRRSFKQAVLLFIRNLMTEPPEIQQDFDVLHHQCCQQCLEANSLGEAHIRYGQAQKLVNMSLKYLYNEFATYYPNANRFQFPDNNVEYLFHLPIDKQIRTRLVTRYHFSDPTSLPWSKWTYGDYITFQSQLRARINHNYKPLEIDYLLWNTEEDALGNAII
jgi:hypothetical protein